MRFIYIKEAWIKPLQRYTGFQSVKRQNKWGVEEIGRCGRVRRRREERKTLWNPGYFKEPLLAIDYIEVSRSIFLDDCELCVLYFFVKCGRNNNYAYIL